MEHAPLRLVSRHHYVHASVVNPLRRTPTYSPASKRPPLSISYRLQGASRSRSSRDLAQCIIAHACSLQLTLGPLPLRPQPAAAALVAAGARAAAAIRTLATQLSYAERAIVRAHLPPLPLSNLRPPPRCERRLKAPPLALQRWALVASTCNLRRA